jgi:hypothetical protein
MTMMDDDDDDNNNNNNNNNNTGKHLYRINYTWPRKEVLRIDPLHISLELLCFPRQRISFYSRPIIQPLFTGMLVVITT